MPIIMADSAKVRSDTSLSKKVLAAACTPMVPLEKAAEFKYASRICSLLRLLSS